MIVLEQRKFQIELGGNQYKCNNENFYLYYYTTILPTDLKFENYPRQQDIIPLRVRSTNPVELMPQVMFVSMVTHTTQVIVLTVSTFPPHPIYRLHATAFTHTAFMFYT